MRLSPRCYAVLGLAYPPPWPVNAGFITGDRSTLVVDTGASALAAATIHGYAAAAAPTHRIDVINTEKHFDHIGGNSFFRDRGAEIYGHSGIARTPEEFAAERAGYNAAIASPARRSWNEGEVFYRGTSLVNPTRVIDAGTTLDLGDCPVEILLTPGHTPTNLSLFVPSDGVLYCGDCLTNGYVANLDFATPTEWRIWLTSLDRIASLHPGAIVPGHGPVAMGDGVPRLIDTVRKEIELAIATGCPRSQARS